MEKGFIDKLSQLSMGLRFVSGFSFYQEQGVACHGKNAEKHCRCIVDHFAFTTMTTNSSIAVLRYETRGSVKVIRKVPDADIIR